MVRLTFRQTCALEAMRSLMARVSPTADTLNITELAIAAWDIGDAMAAEMERRGPATFACLGCMAADIPGGQACAAHGTQPSARPAAGVSSTAPGAVCPHGWSDPVVGCPWCLFPSVLIPAVQP